MRRGSPTTGVGWEHRLQALALRAKSVHMSGMAATQKAAAAPQSLAALLTACGLEHRAKAFEDDWKMKDTRSRIS